MKKIISIVTILSFLLSNSSFAVSIPSGKITANNVNLAPSLILDGDTSGDRRKALGMIKLQMLLRAVDKLNGGAEGEGEIVRVTDIETLKDRLRRCKYLRSVTRYEDTVRGKIVSDEIKPTRAVVTVCFNQLEQVAEGRPIFSVPVYVVENGKRHQYSLLFSTYRNKDGMYPITPLSKEFYDDLRRAESESLKNAALNYQLPELPEPQAEGLERYAEQEYSFSPGRRSLDQYIKKKMKAGQYAVSRTFYSLHHHKFHNKIYANAGNIFSHNDHNGLVDSSLRFLKTAGVRGDVISALHRVLSSKPLVIIRKSKREKLPQVTMRHEDGRKVKVDVRSHSSDLAVYIVVDAEIYDKMISDQPPYRDKITGKADPRELDFKFVFPVDAKGTDSSETIESIHLYETTLYLTQGRPGWIKEGGIVTNRVLDTRMKVSEAGRIGRELEYLDKDIEELLDRQKKSERKTKDLESEIQKAEAEAQTIGPEEIKRKFKEGDADRAKDKRVSLLAQERHLRRRQTETLSKRIRNARDRRRRAKIPERIQKIDEEIRKLEAERTLTRVIRDENKEEMKEVEKLQEEIARFEKIKKIKEAPAKLRKELAEESKERGRLRKKIADKRKKKKPFKGPLAKANRVARRAKKEMAKLEILESLRDDLEAADYATGVSHDPEESFPLIPIGKASIVIYVQPTAQFPAWFTAAEFKAKYNTVREDQLSARIPALSPEHGDKQIEYVLQMLVGQKRLVIDRSGATDKYCLTETALLDLAENSLVKILAKIANDDRPKALAWAFLKRGIVNPKKLPLKQTLEIIKEATPCRDSICTEDLRGNVNGLTIYLRGVKYLGSYTAIRFVRVNDSNAWYMEIIETTYAPTAHPSVNFGDRFLNIAIERVSDDEYLAEPITLAARNITERRNSLLRLIRERPIVQIPADNLEKIDQELSAHWATDREFNDIERVAGEAGVTCVMHMTHEARLAFGIIIALRRSLGEEDSKHIVKRLGKISGRLEKDPRERDALSREAVTEALGFVYDRLQTDDDETKFMRDTFNEQVRANANLDALMKTRRVAGRRRVEGTQIRNDDGTYRPKDGGNPRDVSLLISVSDALQRREGFTLAECYGEYAGYKNWFGFDDITAETMRNDLNRMTKPLEEDAAALLIRPDERRAGSYVFRVSEEFQARVKEFRKDALIKIAIAHADKIRAFKEALRGRDLSDMAELSRATAEYSDSLSEMKLSFTEVLERFNDAGVLQGALDYLLRNAKIPTGDLRAKSTPLIPEYFFKFYIEKIETKIETLKKKTAKTTLATDTPRLTGKRGYTQYAEMLLLERAIDRKAAMLNEILSSRPLSQISLETIAIIEKEARGRWSTIDEREEIRRIAGGKAVQYINRIESESKTPFLVIAALKQYVEGTNKGYIDAFFGHVIPHAIENELLSNEALIYGIAYIYEKLLTHERENQTLLSAFNKKISEYRHLKKVAGQTQKIAKARVQPRTEDGRFDQTLEGNERAMWQVIVNAPAIKRAIGEKGYFVEADYRVAFEEVKERLGFIRIPSVQVISADFRKLRRKGYLRSETAKTRRNNYYLTPAGESVFEAIRELDAKLVEGNTPDAEAEIRMALLVFGYEPKEQISRLNELAELEVSEPETIRNALLVYESQSGKLLLDFAFTQPNAEGLIVSAQEAIRDTERIKRRPETTPTSRLPEDIRKLEKYTIAQQLMQVIALTDSLQSEEGFDVRQCQDAWGVLAEKLRFARAYLANIAAANSLQILHEIGFLVRHIRKSAYGSPMSKIDKVTLTPAGRFIIGILRSVLALPSEYRDAPLNRNLFAGAFGKIEGAEEIDSYNRDDLLIFSEKLIFENALGVLLPKLANAEIEIAVIASTDKQKKAIEALNHYVRRGKPTIVAVENLEEARQLKPQTFGGGRRRRRENFGHFYHFRDESESEPAIAGIRELTSVAITAQKIKDALREATHLTSEHLLDHAIRLFKEMA